MIPKDPFMLLSYVNTQLRDNYKSLADLCSSLGLDSSEIEDKLKSAGYVYMEQGNKFIPK